MRFIIKIFYTAFYVIMIMNAVLLASALIGKLAHALELDQAYINYRQYTPGGTSYLVTNNGLPDRSLDKGVSLHLDTTFLSYAYWNNTVHAETDKALDGGGQFRTVGWQFQFGVRLTDYLDVEYAHHSQHILDHQGPLPFPREDSFGINLYLYRPKNHHESIF